MALEEDGDAGLQPIQSLAALRREKVTKRATRLALALGTLALVSCRSTAGQWPAAPRGVGKLEYKSKPAHFSYWVDHRVVGTDLDRAIEALRSRQDKRVAVRSEYKLADWGCELSSRLRSEGLEIVSFLMPSARPPGWRDLTPGLSRCGQERQSPQTTS
jgi:hypothetical protein